MILFGLEASKISSLFWVLVFASLSINFISALCASFNVAENKAALLTILALPLLIPVLLLSFDQNAKLLCALAVFCSVVSVFAASAIVKIAAE
jgi:ABC-type transport system involved in cytochrome c biogenesis permease component